jgi:actin cytoskeleton-regulatory complex protein SLA1
MPPPALPSRPTNNAAAAPIPKVPERPTVPTSRPVTKDESKPHHHGSAESKLSLIKVPDVSKIREWKDKSGSFSVEAAYIAVVDNKVQLHKANGVKIAVPLEKLDASALQYVRSIPGNESLHLSSVPTPALPHNSKTGQSRNNLDQPSNPEHLYNDFDWREWLVKAGVASADASSYAKKFVEQRMDQTILPDIDRETLRSMSITEGDIIRIRKAANLPMVTPAFHSKAAANESKAQQMNLAFLQSKQNSNQLASDEAYARQLQAQEDQKSRSGRPSEVSSNASSGTVNLAALKAAGSLLKQEARSSTVASSNPVAFRPGQSTQMVGNSSSLGLKGNNNTVSNNDPWASFPTGQNDPKDMDSQKKAAEAQKTLAAAQQAILKAQEQARQAALLEQQTKAMQLQQQQHLRRLKKLLERLSRCKCKLNKR